MSPNLSEARSSEGAPPRRIETSYPIPTLERALAIARHGSQDPGSLGELDVQDMSRMLLFLYAQMGIR